MRRFISFATLVVVVFVSLSLHRSMSRMQCMPHALALHVASYSGYDIRNFAFERQWQWQWQRQCICAMAMNGGKSTSVRRCIGEKNKIILYSLGLGVYV